MDQEQEIIDTADKWNAQEQATQRERLRIQAQEQRMRHERRKGWIRTFLIVGVVAAILGTAAVPAINAFHRWRDQVALEAEAQRVLQAAKEVAWETCIQTQGIEACTWIEERALRSCYHRWDRDKTQDCIEKRLTDMGAL